MSETIDSHNRKKRRVKQACDYCRSKKAKCDGKTPVCSTCAVNSESCTYTQSSKRRGLPTGYTHDLEKKVLLFQALFASLLNGNQPDTQNGGLESQLLKSLTDPLESRNLIRNIGNLQVLWDNHALSDIFNQFIIENNSAVHDAKNCTTGLASLSNAQQQQQRHLDTGLISNPTNFSTLLNNPLFNVSNGKMTQDYNLVNDPSYFLKDDIFQFISDELEDTKDNWEPVALQYHGLSSLISGFTTKSIQQYNNKLLLKQKNPFRVGSIFNVSSAAITASIANTIKLPIEIFQFPDNLRKLVDYYFQIYHTWLPMLDRLSIIRQIHHLQFLGNNTNSSSFQASDCNLIALLWAIIALGKSGTSSNSSNDRSANTISESYAKNAIMALENSLTSTIETIQAMLLLGLYYYQQGEWDYSWVLISSSTRMALDVRLMTPATSNNDDNNQQLKKETGSETPQQSTTLDKIIRERTWSTVYVINTLLAARMGRTPLIRAMDWPVPTVNSDGWEEWESWKSYHAPNVLDLDSGRCLLTFNQFIKVVSVLNLAITCTIDTSEDTLANDQSDSTDNDSKLQKVTNKAEVHGLNKHTLAYFDKLLDECLAGLPDYCKTEHFPSSEKIPPMVALLHLSFNLTWCILAIRLSALKSTERGDTIKDKIIKFRDQRYTKSVKSIRELVNINTIKNLKYYPFIDHFILMGFNFSKMMVFDSKNNDNNEVLKSNHVEQFRSLLVNAALTSIPCKISWDLYKIMNGISDDLLPSMSRDSNAMEMRKKSHSTGHNQKVQGESFGVPTDAQSPYSAIFNQVGSSSFSPLSTNTQVLPGSINTPTTMTSSDSKDFSIIDSSESKDANLKTIHEGSGIASDHSLLEKSAIPFSTSQLESNAYLGNSNPFSPLSGGVHVKSESQSQPKYTSNMIQAPRDELDLFMLDTDFARNDARLDKFMRNLGYINNNNTGDNQNNNFEDFKRLAGNSNEKMFIQAAGLPMTYSGNASNKNGQDAELQEYLQKMMEKNA